ncbi:MAG: glycoside hydrolase family 2, partial [Proteiniphilum sp.]
MKKLTVIVVLFCIALMGFNACTRDDQSPRKTENFNSGWRFFQGDLPKASNMLFDDTGWRQLELPHDWAIEGDFSEDHPSGSGGGALPGG